MAGVYLLFTTIPRISPRGFGIERFGRVYRIFQSTILAFLLLMSVLVPWAGTGANVPIARAVYVGVGLVFVVLGNFLGKVTKNFFVGIRTPVDAGQRRGLAANPPPGRPALRPGGARPDRLRAARRGRRTPRRRAPPRPSAEHGARSDHGAGHELGTPKTCAGPLTELTSS